MRGVWIIGTDTEIGKTAAAAALLEALALEDESPFYVKPVQTGVMPGKEAPDLAACRSSGAPGASLAMLAAAASPELAARLEGRRLSAAELLEAWRRTVPEDAFVVAEGAGGLLAPLNDEETTLDLVQRTGLPVLLVVGNKLGCLSHAALTLSALEGAGVRAAGILLNRARPESELDPGAGDDAENQRRFLKDNARAIRRLGDAHDAPLLADIAWQPGGRIPAQALREAARSLIACLDQDAETRRPMLKRALDFDRRHLWHPYAPAVNPPPVEFALSAHGRTIVTAEHGPLIDGTSSWWCAPYGFGVPALAAALSRQAQRMAHVMFGGFTHAPAVEAGERLRALLPAPLSHYFFSDSGSVAIEVAQKMALQYWQAKGSPEKRRFLAPLGGYHGDTEGAMSVSDPQGMHARYRGALREHVFIERPASRFGEPFEPACLAPFERALREHEGELAGVILEPILQAAGGMHFYHPEYLRAVRRRCDEAGLLLIADEIATGFGRTGRTFACEHAGVVPDVMCLGKALTGGMLGLAVTAASEEVAAAVSGDASGGASGGAFIHGPTFMANPVACAAAAASLALYQSRDWCACVREMEAALRAGLEPLRGAPGVADVRALGAVGVVECDRAVKSAELSRFFVSQGVWIRPFGRLIYLMPAYTTTEEELERLLGAVRRAVLEARF